MPLAPGESRPRRYSAEVWRVAEEMLDDGCSYSEVSRTLGPTVQSIAARFPGRGWTPQQSNEHRRVLSRRDAHLSLARSLLGEEAS